MCGIVAVLPVYRGVADAAGLASRVAQLPERLSPAAAFVEDPRGLGAVIEGLLGHVEALLTDLSEPSAAALLVCDAGVRQALAARCDVLLSWADELDRSLDAAGLGDWGPETTEFVQGELRRLKDRLYSVTHDRLEVAELARNLVPAEPGHQSATSYLAVQMVLAALNHLEVRGRDSAGLTVWVHLDEPDQAGLAAELASRSDPLFRDGCALPTANGACFVYKHAAIVGKLGDNVAALRKSIQQDATLHRLLSRESARVTVVSHTRWASVGRISEANAHPVDSRRPAGGVDSRPFAVAALNGDIDNYAALQEAASYRVDELGVSTDAKIIPVMLVERLADGAESSAAIGACLADFAGSMAIVAQADTDTGGELLLAVKGSGQSLYVGLAASGFVVASEVYGLVPTTPLFLRVSGEAATGASRPGTVVRLASSGAGTLDALSRWDADGAARPVDEAEVRRAEVTTRDLALGSAEHYLQKEIHEAPSSFRRTLRGRIQQGPAGPVVSLSDSSVPGALRARLQAGEIRELTVIGQGTAAVACQGVAQLVRTLVGDHLTVTAMPASEFSAWHLRADMSGTCVLAVSQSGTTTDTNRSVDLARERGATILSVVNRRDSDLAIKSHGVLYTSDGRDVEMSVASTKAFYAQVAAGCLLGIEFARELGALTPERESGLLDALRQVPDRLSMLRELEPQLAQAAADVVTRYPYWAVVGSGPSAVAAAEIRIKLSELCYKTISTDAIEDKKHIDLSAEALVLVCAAGALPNQLSDLVKEVEILAAHGNYPIVFCDEGTEQMWPRSGTVIRIPAGHPDLAWIVTTAAGHLFAYHAARCIDAAANGARIALTRLEAVIDAGYDPAADLPLEVLAPVMGVLDAAHQGDLRGVLTSQAAVRLAQVAMLPRVSGLGNGFPVDRAETASLARAALTAAIDELARPIDTVKHQAKTVTVGTSRDDADLYENEVIWALQDIGLDRHCLTLASLRVVRGYARVIEEVIGVTRYRVMNKGGRRSIEVSRKTGIAAELTSRADRPTPLAGSKRRVSDLRVPRLLRGHLDGRVVLVVPEQENGQLGHLCVVHVRLREVCPIDDLLAALRCSGERLAEIEAAVTEIWPSFVTERLRELTTEEVMLAPVEWVAERLGDRTGSAVTSELNVSAIALS